MDESTNIDDVGDCRVSLTKDTLIENDIINYLKSDECGAQVIFTGSTRNHHEGRIVTHLEYEAFNEMALKQLNVIGRQMKEKWPGLHKIALIHRLGPVMIGEVSVIVGASSPHRKESLSAVEFGIEQIKAKVAIWKKEYYDEGDNKWQQNKECAWLTAK